MHFLGEEELGKSCSKRVRRTQPDLRTRLLLLYTSAMASTVNKLNINGNARCKMFKR